MPNCQLSSESYELDVVISASIDRVWNAIADESSQWWPSDFVTSERTKRFVIEARLGGRVFEDFGSGDGLVWYTVIGVVTGSELVLAGHLLPPFGGPATTSLRISLSALGVDTLVKIQDVRFGNLEGDSPIEGWQAVFEAGLRHYLESEVKTD